MLVTSFPFSCLLFLPPSRFPASCSHRFIYLSISSSTASLQNEFCLTASAGVKGEQSEHMKVSKCFNCLKYTIFSYVSCRSTLTEDNSLDGEVLYFVLVIFSPPVDVFGQSVSKKLCHYPPHTVFVGQTSRQVEVRDLHRKNDVHINSLVYTPCGIPPPQKTIYNNCYK